MYMAACLGIGGFWAFIVLLALHGARCAPYGFFGSYGDSIHNFCSVPAIPAIGVNRAKSFASRSNAGRSLVIYPYLLRFLSIYFSGQEDLHKLFAIIYQRLLRNTHG
jgi:hypothetical protein